MNVSFWHIASFRGDPPISRFQWAKRTWAGSRSRYNLYEYTRQSVLAAIRRFRIEHALLAEFERHRPGFAERHRAIKARAAAGVAGARDLFDLDPNRVLIAIDSHLDDALDVAARLALLPQRAA